MWLMMMNWVHDPNHFLILMITLPLVWFTVKFTIDRLRSNEEEEKDGQHHDWISQLESQLRQFEKHSRKIEKMGLNFEYIHEENDPKKNLKKKKKQNQQKLKNLLKRKKRSQKNKEINQK